VLGDAARALVEPMKSEIARLEAQAARLTTRVDVLLARVDELLAETEECHRDRDADRLRLSVLEAELARYKVGGPPPEHP
jgi:chromosome segregation ATPase